MRSLKQLQRFRNSLERNPTIPEQIFAGRLDAVGISYEFQPIIGFYIADFLITDKLLIIELDGSSHYHRQQSDAHRTSFLQAAGFIVLRIPNHQAKTYNLASLELYPTRTEEALKQALLLAATSREEARRQKFRRRNYRRTIKRLGR